MLITKQLQSKYIFCKLTNILPKKITRVKRADRQGAL